MIYQGLSDPKWSLSIRYAEAGTLTKKTRTLSGVNFAGLVVGEESEEDPEGYDALTVGLFVTDYLQVAQGTLDTKSLTAQFNFE